MMIWMVLTIWTFEIYCGLYEVYGVPRYQMALWVKEMKIEFIYTPVLL